MNKQMNEQTNEQQTLPLIIIDMKRTGERMAPANLFYKREIRLGELPSI